MIPKTFKLHGATITVRIVPPSKWRHSKNCEGMWLPNRHRIDILKGPDRVHMQRVFCHEACHAILDFINSPLSRDEAFVDNLASGVHQMWTTVEG